MRLFSVVVSTSVLVDWHPLFYNSFLELLWDADHGVVLCRGFICVMRYLSIKWHQAAIISSADLYYIFLKKSTDIVRVATSRLFPQRIRQFCLRNLNFIRFSTYTAGEYWSTAKLPKESRKKKGTSRQIVCEGGGDAVTCRLPLRLFLLSFLLHH